MDNFKQFVLMICAATFFGCDELFQNDGASVEVGVDSTPKRHFDKQQLAIGGRIYRQHCAVCHGPQAEGDPNWRQRGADGMYPPPALNGSAHAWHHPVAVLKEVIAKGSPQGMGKMPAWEGKLTDDEIDAVIIWFQSLWPDQVYAAWYEAQLRR